MSRVKGATTTIFAVWRGEEFLFMGNINEVCNEFNIKPSYVYSKAYDKNQKEGPNRLYFLKVEDIEDEILGDKNERYCN